MFGSLSSASGKNVVDRLARRRAAGKGRMDRLVKAVAAMESLEVRALMSGTFSFAAPVDFNTLSQSTPNAMVVTDVNGDGVKDVVTLSNNGDVNIFIGNDNGTFQPSQVVHNTDIAGTVGEQNLAVATVNGQVTIFASSKSSQGVAFDVANSGGVFSEYGGAAETDLTFAHHINALTVAQFGTHQVLVIADDHGNVDFATLSTTGPGFSGIAGSASQVDSVITYGTNNASTAALLSLATGNFISSGAGTDLVVVGANGQAAVVKGTSSGLSTTFGTVVGVTTATGVFSTGTSSIVMQNSSGTLSTFVGLKGTTPSAAFATSVATLTPGLGAAETVAIGDFNGDGVADIAVAHGSSFDILQGMAGSPGNFTLSEPLSTGDTHGVSLAAGDLNGDGEADLVTGYYLNSSSNAFIGVAKNTSPLIPSFTSGTTISTSVGVFSTFTVTTHGFPAGKITASGLPGGLSLHDNGDGTAIISGKPGAVSKLTFTVNLKATNASGTGTQTLTVTVAQAPTFVGPAQGKFNEAVNVVFPVKATGGFPAVTMTATFNGSAISSTAVDGLTFTQQTSDTFDLEGTATSAADGTDTLVVTATSGAGGPGVQKTFKVVILQAPVFGGISSQAFTVGTFGTTGNVTVTGFPAPQVSTGSGALPAGLSFRNNGDGTFVISGTPKPGTGGAHVVHLDAHNQEGHATVQPFVFTVNVAEQPVITSANSATFNVGQAGESFIVKATGNTGSGLPSFSSSVNNTNGIINGTLPGGMTFTDLGNGTARISGTPSAGTGGVYTLTIQSATDKANKLFTSDTGLTAATQTFSLLVVQAPGYASATGSSSVGAGAAITPITIAPNSGFSAAPTTATIVNGKLPKGLSFTTNSVGVLTISGTPAFRSEGTYQFDVKVTNTDGSATQHYTLTVETLPIFSDHTLTKNVTATHAVAVNQTFMLATAPSAFKNLTDIGAGLTQNGLTLALNGSGTALLLTGTPVATGTTTFTFTLQTNDTLVTSPSLSIVVTVG